MRSWTHSLAAVSLAVGLTAAPARAADENAGNTHVTKGELWARAGALRAPSREIRLGPDQYGRDWDFRADDRGNFTYFDQVDEVHATEEGALSFTLTDQTGTLGWGNVGGRQPDRDRVLLWTEFQLQFDIRQSKPADTRAALRFWAEGQRDRAAVHTMTVTGTVWQTVTWYVKLRPPRRDGFELEIAGPAGDRISIRNLQIARYAITHCFRKTVTLPDGKIWRALVDVGGQLFVNGVDVTGESHAKYDNVTRDISPYLKPAQENSLALYGELYSGRPGSARYTGLRGSVIIDSGERIVLDTDDSWVWSPEPVEGWTQTGFDDGAWARVKSNGDMDTEAVVRPGWYIFYWATGLPAYDGFIRLANPGDSQLYYTDDQPVRCHALAPQGLAERSPALKWTVKRYKSNAFTEVAAGVEDAFDTDGDSIRFALDAGRLPRGVYVLTTTLTADGTALDARVPEALVVTGRLPMRETDGATYTQDMDLELERQIDLTDPGDGPWIETAGGRRAGKPVTDPDAGIKKAAIVTRNGLTYRETRPNWGAIVSYLVTFKHPGDFYLMELDYPNDTARLMGVACSPATWGLTRGHSKSSASVTTGGRYPVTGKMQTLRWVYRPDPCNHSLNLLNMKAGAPAAAASLRIFHIKNGLPALRVSGSHTRLTGTITERTKAERARFSVTGQTAAESREAEKNERYPDAPMIVNLCERLTFYLDACEAFASYMRFAGQNVHIMGSFQYHRSNPPAYVSDWSFPCGRVAGGIRDILARVLRDNGIDFYAHVEYIDSPGLLKIAREFSERPLSGFWNTPYLVEPDGRAYTGWGGRYGFNFNHPAVREEMLATGEDLTHKFRTLDNFKGIVWTAYFTEWLPTYRQRLHRGPWSRDEFTHYGYGDVSIREFENDTGLTVPFSLDDPERFRKRHQYLNAAPMRPEWLAWRAERMAGFFHDLAATMHRLRKDLLAVCGLYMNPEQDVEWRRSGMSFADYMLANGWDGGLFAADPTVCVAPTLHGVLNTLRGKDARTAGLGWDMSSSPERYAFFRAETNRAVHIKHFWRESEETSWNLPYREGWPRQFQLTMMYQPDGDNTREVFTRALIGADPDLFFYGFADATLLEGNEQPLREFNQAVQALPIEKFSPVQDTGLNTTLALRALTLDDTTWFTVANPGYWPVTGTVTLEHAARVWNAVNNEIVAEAGANGRTRVNIDLAPFGVAVFKASGSPRARCAEWHATAVRGKATEHLEAIVKRTEQLLAMPAARVVLTPDDEHYVREVVASANKELADGEYAAALLATSADRFWTLKTEYMEKGAAYATETERGEPMSMDRKSAVAHWAGKPPVIDAGPDDVVWQQADTYTGFICADRMPAMAQTEFQVAADDKNLYLFVRCKDRNPESVKMEAKQEKDIWRSKDDAVALFIRPDMSTSTYYQLALTARGVTYDQKVTGGARDNVFSLPWDVATEVTDEGWVAEIRIPAAALQANTAKGHTWGFNIHRAFRNGKVPPSSWSFSPVGWHDITRLGTLTFQAPSS